MKIVTLELARTGRHGQEGVLVTRKDLEEIVQTFSQSVPVTIGHSLADWMPAFGRVVRVWLSDSGDVLLGDVELSDPAAEAYDAGYYNAWSIGAPRNHEGKRYLHHLALLGAMPPAVKGLRELAAVNLSDVPASFLIKTNTEDNMENKKTEKTPAKKASPDKSLETETVSFSDAAKEQSLLNEIESFKRELATHKAEKLLLLADNKIPADKMDTLKSLAEELALREDALLLGDGEEKKSALAALAEILSALPDMVLQGQMQLADNSSDRVESVYTDLTKYV